jgi:hypothetical protein
MGIGQSAGSISETEQTEIKFFNAIVKTGLNPKNKTFLLLPQN